MKIPVRRLVMQEAESARREMEAIGVDPAGIRLMAPKFFLHNLKLSGLSCAEANIIKQDALSLGAEAAVARGVASCEVAESDCIVSGTEKQLRRLVDKLKFQPYRLRDAAEGMEDALANLVKKDFVWRCAGRELRPDGRTLVMGILNLAPDSFHEASRCLTVDVAVKRASDMVRDGADMIDVGGESTRPGALPVDEAEEIRRVAPVIEALAKEGLIVSVDTMKAGVAAVAMDKGAAVINDVSAMGDPLMAEVAARHRAGVVLMHMRGTPETMQRDVRYQDMMAEIFGHLALRMDRAVSSGIDKDSIVIDPGLGFGKSREGNFEILGRLGEFSTLGRPVLVGASRKSFIGHDAGERLPGSLAAVVSAVLNGADIVRVHDVKETVQALEVADNIKGKGGQWGKDSSARTA